MPHVFIILGAIGGVFGALLGVIAELRSQYSRVDRLNQRNRALNRLLRHDIRNDVNVIMGYLDLIADEADGVNDELIDPVHRMSEKIIETSTIAREIQQLEAEDSDGPLNLVPVVTDCVTRIRATYPEAEITTDLPDEAWAAVGTVFKTVINNLVENAIEHNDQTPEVTIGIDPSATEEIIVRVTDNGPGIPAGYQETMSGEHPPAAAASAGLGLWLVKWFVDSSNGTISVEDNDPRGAVVSIHLPKATPPGYTRTTID